MFKKLRSLGKILSDIMDGLGLPNDISINSSCVWYKAETKYWVLLDQNIHNSLTLINQHHHKKRSTIHLRIMIIGLIYDLLPLTK